MTTATITTNPESVPAPVAPDATNTMRADAAISAASSPGPSSADSSRPSCSSSDRSPGPQEHVITGSVLLAFAAAWAMLAVLSQRWTDQPQRWAFVPAAFMALAGALHPRRRADRQRGSDGCGRRSLRRSPSG